MHLELRQTRITAVMILSLGLIQATSIAGEITSTDIPVSEQKAAAAAAQATPTAIRPRLGDGKLAGRLTSQQVFRTRKGDTFSELASILYGHASWWEKIKLKNPNLAKYGPYDALPANTSVTYPAPVIGDQYVVQPGDYLIRVAAWKYGDLTSWEQLYERNKDRIQNPNLIHPGDVLSLDASGRMVNRQTGQVVFEGDRNPAVEGAATEGTEAPSSEAELTAARAREAAMQAKAYLADISPTITLFGHEFNRAFVIGFAVGTFLLLLLPIQWLIAKATRRKVSPDTSLAFHVDLPPPGQTDTDEDEKLEETGQHHFKKRPLELYRFDRSLIPDEYGEAAKKGGYHALTDGKKRKYLKRKAS